MLFLAQLGGGAGGGKGGSFLQLVIPFGLMFAIMYFLMIRPQRKKEKDRQEMLKRVRKGDKVVSSGGIHGKITTVRENTLIVCVDEAKDINLKIDRNSVTGVTLTEDDEEEE